MRRASRAAGRQGGDLRRGAVAAVAALVPSSSVPASLRDAHDAALGGATLRLAARIAAAAAVARMRLSGPLEVHHEEGGPHRRADARAEHGQ